MEKICRHPNLVGVEGYPNIMECTDCGVWKGDREDSHAYIKEYFYTDGFSYFRNGIPRRKWSYNNHKIVWKELGFDPSAEENMWPAGLEIGFGIGRLMWSMLLDGWKMFGVDSSSWACTWIKEVYGEHPQVFECNFEHMDKKILMDALQNTLPDKEGFDFIYACHVLEHFENPMKAIEDCYDLLAPGGKLFFGVPNKEHQLAMPHMHNWAFDEKSLRTWFEQAGLKKIKTANSVCYNAKSSMPGRYIYILGVKE
jgi:SAM-dependent methyltransferase